ncbi:hypothetical protein M91_14945, partial [Bos mutus]
SRGRHRWSGGSSVSSGRIYASTIEKKEYQELNVLSCCSENKDADPESVVYTFFMQEHYTKGE